MFARALRGLAATKLTKPGTFRCMDGGGEGHALRCSYKARPQALCIQLLQMTDKCYHSVTAHMRKIAVIQCIVGAQSFALDKN